MMYAVCVDDKEVDVSRSQMKAAAAIRMTKLYVKA
jgi:hypothetical protein